MKKKILILLLLLSVRFDVFSQFVNPFSYYNSKPISGVNYVQRSWDFFNRVTALGKTLTTAQQRWYNDSIFVPLIADGIIGTTRAGDSLAFLHAYPLVFAGDSTISRMNLLSTDYTAINAGMIYTDSGIVGGTGKFMDLILNPVTDSAIFKHLSCGFGFYSRTFNSQNAGDMTFNNTQNDIVTNYLDGNSYVSIMAANYTGVKFGKTKGFHGVFRETYTQFTYHVNGSDTTILSNFSNYASGTGSFKLGAGYLGGSFSSSSNYYAFDFGGSGLSTDKRAKLSTRLNNSLKGRNYNVY